MEHVDRVDDDVAGEAEMAAMWVCADDVGGAAALEALDGYDVVASDGTVGHVERTGSMEAGGWLVVDTGFWIFGTKRIIPAGLVRRVDHDQRAVHVAVTKEAVGEAPEYDEAATADDPAGAERRRALWLHFGRWQL